MSQGSICTAVITAAGLGTRLLPATKAVPKELLPVFDRPAIQYIVEEAARAGLRRVIPVIAEGKSSIVQYFRTDSALEALLEKQGRLSDAETVRHIARGLDIEAVYQQEPRGLGDAVLSAKTAVGDRPFAVLLGDDIIDAEPSCLEQLLCLYARYRRPVVALTRVEDTDVPNFGICGGIELAPGVWDLNYMVEKPRAGDTPHRLGIIGRYLLTPRIFSYLEQTPPGRAGEIQLTDAMARLMADEGFIGCEFSGRRYDAGDRLGTIKATLAYALKHPEIAPRLVDHLGELLARFVGPRAVSES